MVARGAFRLDDLTKRAILAGIDRARQAADDPAHHQRHQDHVIDPAEQGDEIGDDVERIDQVESDEQRRRLEVKRRFGGEEGVPELDDFLAEQDEAGEEHLEHG